MVVKVYNGFETIYMDDVSFVNEENHMITVQTNDGKTTEIANAEDAVELFVFEDNGVRINEN